MTLAAYKQLLRDNLQEVLELLMLDTDECLHRKLEMKAANPFLPPDTGILPCGNACSACNGKSIVRKINKTGVMQMLCLTFVGSQRPDKVVLWPELPNIMANYKDANYMFFAIKAKSPNVPDVKVVVLQLLAAKIITVFFDKKLRRVLVDLAVDEDGYLSMNNDAYWNKLPSL